MPNQCIQPTRETNKVYPEIKSFSIELNQGDIELVKWRHKIETDEEVEDFLQKIIGNQLLCELIP